MVTFDEIKADFWDPSRYDVQLPLTDELVREAEDSLGVTLPVALIELLRVKNGGVPANRHSRFPAAVPSSWAEDHVPFDGLMGIGRMDGFQSLLNTPYLVGEWDLPEPIVLLNGDGHYWIALDYRKVGRQGEPEVVWLDTDTGEDLILAPDFRSFVEGLVGDHDES